jgi:hypothetical protein
MTDCGYPTRRGPCSLPARHEGSHEWIPPVLPFCKECKGVGCEACNFTGLEEERK